MSDVTVVAGNGVPLNTIGWMAPIVREHDFCFVLGGKRDKRFPGSELLALADAGLITLFVARDVPISSDENSGGPETDRELSFPFALSHYILYGNRDDLHRCEVDYSIDLGEECAARGVPLVLRDSQGIMFRFVSTTELKSILQVLYEKLLPTVTSLLRSQIGERFPDLGMLNSADTAATLLYQTAYDKQAAREAIALRTVATCFAAGSDVAILWTKRAAEAWGWPTSDKFWFERVQGTIVSLATQKAFVQARALLRPEDIERRLIDDLKQWWLGQVAEAAIAERDKNKVSRSNIPDIPSIKSQE